MPVNLTNEMNEYQYQMKKERLNIFSKLANSSKHLCLVETAGVWKILKYARWTGILWQVT